jgi:outer membrane lipoprotein carrier protein
MSCEWFGRRVFRLGFLLGVSLISLDLPLATAADQVPAESAPQAPVQSNAASDALSERLSGLETFSAEFVQYIVDKSGSTVQHTSGQLKAMRPGKFYWATNPPLEQYVRSVDGEVWVYDPDLEQVTVHKVDDNVSSTPAILLSGDVRKLDASYAIEQMQSAEVTTFLLTPKGEDSLFETLRLRFIDDNLVEMRLMDGLGQKTTLSFRNMEVNKTLTDKDFEILLPEGVDIIRE